VAEVSRLSDETLVEVVHGDFQARIRREELLLAGQVPLVVQRTTRPGGASLGQVLLVHGLAQNRFSWRVTGRSLVARLADEGFEVLNLELRGHGRSREVGAPNARSFDEYVNDVCRVIDTLGARPFLVGHSLGGAVGIGTGLERPLAGLVHLAGVYRFAAHNRTLRALARLSLRAESALMAAPLRVSTGWAGALIGRLYAVSDVAGYGFPVAGWTPDSIERDLLEERLRLGFDWTSVEVWLEMCRWSLSEVPAFAQGFADLDLPLLVMAGDHDVLVRPRDAAAAFEASGSTDKTLCIFDSFDNQVHWGHVDLILGRKAPEETWPRLVQWLQKRS